MTVDVGLYPMTKVVFVRFLHCKFNPLITPPPTFQTKHFGRRSILSSYLKSTELRSHSLKVNYLFSPILIYLIIYLYQYTVVNIYFTHIYNGLIF